MSSKDQHKKNPGQGKGNSTPGKGNQSSKSTGKKEDQGGGNPNKGQGKSKQNPNSSGKKEALIKKPAKTVNQQGQQEKNIVKQQHQQTVSQKKTSIQIGINNSQKLINATNLFSNNSGPSGILQLAATALSHISLNIQNTTVESTSSTFCSNTTKQETGNMNRGRGTPKGNTRGNFRGNTRNNSRGNTRGNSRGNTIGNSRGSYRGTSGSQNHLSGQNNKLTTAPTQIRVFSGNQESNQSFADHIRPQSNIANRSNFHKQNSVHRGAKHQNVIRTPESPNQISGFRHLSPQNFAPSVRNKQQINPKHFLRGNANSPNYEHQNKQFNSSNRVNFGANSFPYSPNIEQYSHSNASFYPQSAQQISSQARAPVFKSKKDKRVSENLNQPPVGAKQIRDNFIEKQEKGSKKRSRRQQQRNFRKSKKISNNNAAPLLSFQRILSNATEKSDSVHSDEDSVSLSRCSSDESIWTTTVSDDAADQSSDESEVTSEVSVTSSFKDSGITSYASDLTGSNISTNDKLISYYWDIENCPVPHQKSPTDFVKRVRETYRGNRYEFEFVAVCDVTKLHETIVEELNASEVSMTHVSFVSKNAADAKIKSMLQTFPEKSFGACDRAIVLISGDSDFANTLNNLKYKYHVLIYLICKNNARHSLIATADKCCFYEDFIKGLPMRTAEKKKSYLITLKNLAEAMKTKKIKSFVNDRLKGMNYRIRVIDGKNAEIIFQNDGIRDKALLLLKNRMIAGCDFQISCSEVEDILMTKTLNNATNINEKKNLETRIKSSVKKASSSEVKENSGNKGATLCVCVSTELGNEFYWKIVFEKLWETNEFDLIWDEKSNYFLVNFKSLSKAQKSKKILQKQQKKDPTSPKFLKLIKQDDISITLNPITQVYEINKQKVEEHIRVIESKKDLCLKKYKENSSNLKSISTTDIHEATEVISQKYNELNEQKVNFLNFYSSTIDRIKSIDVASDTIDKDLELISRDYSRECTSFSTFLPIYAKKNVILKKVKKHQIVLIRAETGSGKSTQLVQYVWRDQFMNNNEGMIICTQPRKIAAIALAKHVSSQIGCSLGDIVGYQVGVTSKKSSSTSIMYVTDVTMLKMLVNDGLKDVSCIIVDEAHERTVYTDLLLGMIKSYLTSRPDLRLIITSATIDTSVFLNYFCLPTECILEVCGRTFPIEDVWLEHDVVLGWDYFRKAIDTVDNILNQEPEGDILVFLTTPFETEKAMKLLFDKLSDKLKQSIVILQLHGKLDVTEQQKVFERTSKAKRKVVFATNCAETSITIPGIKYVVDCGLVKESQYDSIRNMNVMCVNFVSQSSSQQRRGRAGRTQVGKCYHLYSKSNYEKMVTNSDPEILRCNLGNALLKLMKIGVKNPVQFDFVQPPSPEALNAAMAQLIKLQAVQENLSLTDLGEKMSCLPVEPRLSHLIFKGIENFVAYEAVILASLVTVSRNIFFRTSENKSEADVKKMRFCQSESDFITYFDIYKEWASLPKQAKSKWCVLNCINARSLRTAQELVNEISHILDKEVKIKIGSKFKEESVHEILLKIVFHSFYPNLCIYSGHPKFGYLSVNTSGNLLIHPSSSLYTFGNWRPQFLVYDSILRTDKTYLINVSPVSNEVVLEGETIYGIQLNLADLETLPLHTYSIAPVGKTIILHNIIGKQGILKRNLESKLKELMDSDSVIIDANISKGEIKIFAPQSKEDIVQSVFCPLIKDAQDSLLMEEKEIVLYSNLYAVISAGAEIKDAILPGEFRDLKVVLKDETAITDVVEKLQTCGAISTVCEFKHYCKITFESPVQAKLALQLFQNIDSFSLQKIIKNNIFDDRANQYKIFVSFLRRKCNGIAFITIEPLSAISEVLGLFQRRTISYQNSILQFSVSRKTQDIKITGLPLETELHDFREFLNSQLIGEYKISKCIVTRDAGSDVTNYDVECTKQKIFDLFVQFTSNDKLSVDIKKPSPKDTKWHSFVYFKNCHDGETAVTILKNRKIPDMPGLRMKPMLQTFLYCKLEVFSVIKVQVEKALEFFKSNSVVDKTLEITVVPKGESNVQIQITSNNISDITDARKAILNCLLGDQIQCPDDEKWEKLFSKSGLAFLKEISDVKPDCYLEINIHKKIVTVFGNESICNAIKIEVNNFLEKLEEEDFAEIYLMPDNGKPGVLKTLLKKYGYDLSNLKEICDATSFEVNTRDHILFVMGSTAAISKCQDIIAELQRENEDVVYEEDAEICPICFVEVSDSFHRLEYCGHAYCNECLLHFFQSSDDFPLCCISCGAHIVLADFHWACKEAKLSETEVFKKSLQVFVQNRGDIGYCPSPDCPMIFRITSEENIFECPSCNNSICTRCEELYHYGMSCSLHQCCKEDDDYSLKAWMQEDPGNRKLCPFCSSPIEKNGGCNHMTCWKCKSHICWRCLQVFLSADLVYEHQSQCPASNLSETLIVI